jgi:hypothetical protein
MDRGRVGLDVVGNRSIREAAVRMTGLAWVDDAMCILKRGWMSPDCAMCTYLVSYGNAGVNTSIASKKLDRDR